MATLQKIRNRAGLLVGFVGIALFAFIIGDFMRGGSTYFQQTKDKIVVIDGTAISSQEYGNKVEERSEMAKREYGVNTLTDEMQAQVRESVFSNIVNQIILENETGKIGMVVGKSELSDMIIGDNISPMILRMPDFTNPQTGAFDKNALLQFLQTIETDDLSMYPLEMKEQINSSKKLWLYWEQMIKQQKLETKYMTLLSSVIGVNSIEATAAYEENKTKVDFDYLVQNYNSIPDDQVTVSDTEIKQLYNKRKEQYPQEEAVVVSYIAVNIVPSTDDELKIEQEISGLKQEFSESADVSTIVNDHSDIKYLDAYHSLSSLQQLYPTIARFVENATINDVEGPSIVDNSYIMYKLIDKTVAPDSVKVNQLMLPNFNDEAQLQAFGDSLIALMEGADGKTFTQMATEATGGQTDGEMGWITEASIVAGSDAKFKDEIFNAPLNKVFMAKSTRGSHLVQVVEKTKPVTKYKIANIQIAITPSSITYNKLYNDLSQYISKNRTLEAIESSASESGYAVQKGITLTKNQQTLGNIPSSRQAVRWAFESKRGEISNIVECQNNYFVVVIKEGHLKKGYRPLNSVADILKRELLNDKKAEKILADLKAKELINMNQYVESMNAIPQSVKFVTFGTSSISGIGTEPIINARAPFAEVGEIVGPLKGKNGIYILNITSKNDDAQPFNMETQKQMVQSANMYRTYSYMTNLMEKANIQDNRIRFY